MEELATVYVIDDDEGARAAVVELVRTMGHPCAAFASAEDFLCALPGEKTLAGCLVTDVRMTGISGLELQERLQAAGCPLPLIFLTGYADVRLAVEIMRGGAVTVLEKPWKSEELWDAIGQAITLDAARRARRAQREETMRRVKRLSPTQRKVLEMVVKGCSNKQISEKLTMGLRSVEHRRSEIYEKMQAESLAELVRMVVQSCEPEEV